MTKDQKYQQLAEIAGSVSRETYEELVAFETMFLEWACRINLAAPSTLNDVWRRHVLDSAQLFPLAAGARRWLDLGSGGGFPGLVLAFLLKGIGSGSIDLVESNRKKAGFLQTAVGRFSLPARIHARRIDLEVNRLEQPDVVTARALAPLPALLDLASPLLCQGARGLLHKGRDYRREIQESTPLWKFDLVEHTSRVDPDSVVLEISNLERR
ncbi:16S rRNA (guanine(527)-N(7))-methyltransferase RsmG [Mesorhizobium sp. ZMM04-5]|uniref:Ribosomal RNA small subunit methyltransferase G n=1 Tax=Mesorhizobium marinum TaxID=3228790 RepID=A0ABV3QYK1_9HYPH